MKKVKILVINTGKRNDISTEVRRQELLRIVKMESAEVMFFQEYCVDDYNEQSFIRSTYWDTEETEYWNEDASVWAIGKDFLADKKKKKISSASRAAVGIYNYTEENKMLCASWHGLYRGLTAEKRQLQLEEFLSFMIRLMKKQGLPLVIGGDFNLNVPDVENVLLQFRKHGFKLYHSSNLKEKEMVIVSKEISVSDIPEVKRSRVLKDKFMLVLDHEYFVLELNVPGPNDVKHCMENMFIHYRSSIEEHKYMTYLELVDYQRHLEIRVRHLENANTLAKTYVLNTPEDGRHEAVAMELNTIIHGLFKRLIRDIVHFSKVGNLEKTENKLKKIFEITKKAISKVKKECEDHSVKTRMADVIHQGYRYYLGVLFGSHN